MKRPGIALFTACCLSIAAPAQAAWWDRFFGSPERPDATPESAPVQVEDGSATDTALQGDTIARALRAALSQGVDSAIAGLGREDGFWQSEAVRVPIPQSLRGPVALLREAGMGNAVEAFHRSLNRAAEAAVPAAAGIFSTALQQMKLEDVRGILAGGEHAATQYFRARTEGELTEAFRPIVAERITQAGVGSAYRAMVNAAGPYAAMLGAPKDLDGYVTSQALDALFLRIAEEETRIRQSAAARGSAVLQEVFGQASGAP
ncbi:DUF4197 domain-containing protein [Algiphilus sp.]|uniref:DUF4197 domain-containing protein n=1 Tax=Algiphilus sp. TaxID=1872431 RepID=UPI003B52606B